MKTFTLAAVALLVAGTAFAGTPTFSETFDDNARRNNLPVTFAADIGTVFVSAHEASIADDISCDSLSTRAMYVDSPLNTQPFEVRFLHDHPEYVDDSGNFLLDERETFTLKLGAEEVDRFGIEVGFSSVNGAQFKHVSFGPAVEGSNDADRFGELYVMGEPTGIRYGNIFDSVCSGLNRMDGQVLVTYDLYGQDGIYYITLQSNAPTPMREMFGPYDIPEAVLTEGYGACMVTGRSGCGRALVDGAECLAASTHELQPIQDDRGTHRDSLRAGRR
jgi:hypothetical protein